MKVFISWSGRRSQQTAELFEKWIKCVLQATKPWISTQHIQRGARWNAAIEKELAESVNGIICLTRENQNAPWILFEAGALAKGLESTRIYTVLIDLQPSEVKGPLEQFNHTTPNQEGIRKLVHSINANLSDPVSAPVVDHLFTALWDQFETEFQAILDGTQNMAPAAEPTQNQVLDEILTAVKTLSHRVGKIEAQSITPLSYGLVNSVMNKGLPSQSEIEDPPRGFLPPSLRRRFYELKAQYPAASQEEILARMSAERIKPPPPPPPPRA